MFDEILYRDGQRAANVSVSSGTYKFLIPAPLHAICDELLYGEHPVEWEGPFNAAIAVYRACGAPRLIEYAAMAGIEDETAKLWWAQILESPIKEFGDERVVYPTADELRAISDPDWVRGFIDAIIEVHERMIMSGELPVIGEDGRQWTIEEVRALIAGESDPSDDEGW
jgi:hypothetical protein